MLTSQNEFLPDLMTAMKSVRDFHFAKAVAIIVYIFHIVIKVFLSCDI